MNDQTLRGLEIRSTIGRGRELRITIEERIADEPGPDEVTVRIEASPLNPSDQGLLFGAADLTAARSGGRSDRPYLDAPVPSSRMPAMAGRLDQSLSVGFEGAGTVVRAGANAHAMLGRKVGVYGGGMLTQYRTLSIRDCIVLPEDATAADGASMFVNPLTALAMVETMRLEGHTAIVHTAAASNLGQMLVRICLADGVQLVNVVRTAEQAALLRGIGAIHVVDSSTADFQARLTDAIAETGATLAFDAIGGGQTANTILHAMETAANRDSSIPYSRYGSSVLKQVYVYGALDAAPTLIDRAYGTSWSVGGFLIMTFLERIGWEATLRLRARVASELLTTFASHYTRTLSLAQLLSPGVVSEIVRRSTGAKFLVNPNA